MRAGGRLAATVAIFLAVLPGVAAAEQVYDAAGWVKFGCTTYPLNRSSSPTGSGAQDPNLVYDPLKAWDTDPVGSPHYFEGYRWVKTTFTDSAAAATAIATGQKTYNGAINWSDTNAAITPTIVEYAHSLGKRTGTITSVQWSHATPAGLSNAHNVSRSNYSAIALEMVYGHGGTPAVPAAPVLDVIMGCGNPDYNANGQAVARQNTRYVGGNDAWYDMNDDGDGVTSSGFAVVQTRWQFEGLTAGKPTGRYLGVAQSYTTLQQDRSGYSSSDVPYSDPFNSNVPSLATMTRAALNVLDQEPNTGFFLLVEGGAVDWANHHNQLARMIEEHIQFNDAISAVDGYLSADGGAGTAGNNWSNTLVVVTADHDCGMLWGADSSSVAFDPLVNRGAGTMPLAKYQSGDHTNSLVPLYAKGPGSELFAGSVDGTDGEMVARFGLWQGFDGRYVDDTDIFAVMKQAYDSGTKNVILMISDGAGFNTWTATTMYQEGPKPGDANRDNRVGTGDLSIMAGNWLQSGKVWEQGDFTGDGVVDTGDLALMAANWLWSGQVLLALPGGAIPEPAMMTLLTVGGVMLIYNRR